MTRIILLLAVISFASRPALAVDSVVVFNEIHYHPMLDEALNEWVELHNQMAVDIDLSEWSLEGAVDFTFAEGTIIPGGGYLVVASNPGAVESATGVRNVVGPFSGRLNNGTGRLELRDRNDRLMDEVEYRDEGKWPIAPDGSGPTLAKRDPNLTSGSPENWTSSILMNGTPGIRNFPPPDSSTRSFLVPLNALWRYDASGTDLGTAWREPGFDDTSWSGQNGATLLSYWAFDGNATATRGTNGTLMNGVTATTDRNGSPNGALAFNGASSQWVSIPGGGGLNAAAAGAVSMWVKWTGTQDADCCGSYGAVLARQANGQFSDNILGLNNPNPSAAQIVWRQSGGPAPVLITGATIVGTNWHHIVVTFANGGSTLYVDGIAEGSAGGAGLNNNPGTPLSIGAWAFDGGGFSTASIDDVAIWNRPLTAAQVGQLAAQSKTPLDFATPENGIYFAGDGTVTDYAQFRQTSIPLGPTTFYFRHTFQFAGNPAGAALHLDTAVDDGAIFYLNGVEVHRQNMAAGEVSSSTFAASAVGEAALINGISIPVDSLLRGTNVLAVEVHQAGPGDSGMVFGAGLTATVTPPPPVDTRQLLTLHDDWKYDASDTDRGTAWRDTAYDDSTWASSAGVLYAGTGTIDGIPPERVTSITATASSQYPDGRLAMNAVNGSGLNGNVHVNNPPTTMWLNNGTLATPNDLNPFITFDLGAAYNIRSMKVWNYNEANLTARGISQGDILLAGTNGTFSPFITAQAFARAPGTATDFSESFDFGGIEVRYVRFERLTNFPGGDNRFVGLSEVQFFRDVDLRRTQVPLGAVTYYFRKSFHFGGDPTLAELVLNAVFDDGAVFYLNGVEVYRANMPSGPVTHGTVASTAVGNATFTGPIIVPNNALRAGLNVLAVEVHQTPSLSDTDMTFGADLTARVSPPPPEAFDPGGLVFNEISAASESSFQIELVNRGTQTINTTGYIVVRRGGPFDLEYALPAQILAPGDFLVLDSSTLGFGAAAGQKLFLVLPQGRGVADAIEVHERPRARHPDRTGEWLTPSQPTPGASNVFQLDSDVVINEILYHAPPTLDAPAVITSNVVILSYTNEWRYEQSGSDLGTAWRELNYDDNQWAIGRGLLYVTSATLAAPKNTPLSLGPTTYYFRATLVNTGSPAILSMAMRHIMDDGIVVYLNGAEIHRFNMGAAAITYSTTATTAVGNAIQRGPLNIPPSSLLPGTNVIAVEVHQAADPGGDVVFGMEIRGNLELVPAVPFSRSREGWVELYNRSSNQVDLTGWRVDEGIDFRFASNTVIPPGGYLVLAKDPDELLSRFPGITVAGPYENALSRSGERLVLRDAADNAVDVVIYSDDGRWPEPPDGGGASLELRNPWADNSAAEAWAGSDERARSSWRSYSYRGVAAASAVGPDTQWREFVIGLLDAGEVLLDDISVVETNATSPVQLIQNGSFTTGTNTWRIIGNHHGEVIDDPDQPGNKVLRLIATGSTEHMSNHGETTLANGRQVQNGLEYHISFRAKWISGSRLFHTRLYFNRLPRVTRLDIPNLRGTPGTQNTAFVPNIGPTFEGLRHEPAVPGPFAPVTISVKAQDPDGIANLLLWSAVNGGSWSSSPMTSGADGTYSGSLPGKLQGAIVQFYVEATDALGATSLIPSQGTNSRALYQVDDGLAATHGLHNMRLVALTSDSDQLFRTVNLMSNERIGCTVIYDEREVFYDVGLRLKGSEHSRTTTPRLGFNVAFTSAQRFRGVHNTVAIDRSESTGFGQREMLIHQTLNHAGDVPTKYHDLIQVMAPRSEYTGTAELQLARYTDIFLDDQFEDGSDGMVFEYELVYQLNSTDTGTPEGNKIPNPDSVVGTPIRNLGNDKENYRWTFLIKNNEERDDFDRIMQFAKTMELTGAAFNSQIVTNVDVDQWLRAVAVNALSGAGDSYGGDGAQHNVQFYVRPSDRRVLYLPHDVDAFFQVNRPIIPNADIVKLIGVPAHARAYYGHVMDIIATTYNANYMTRWANHFGRLLPAQNFAGHLSFLVQRANLVVAEVNAAVPNVAFTISNNGGNNFTISNNTVTLTGTAPLGVFHIQVNGTVYPVAWTSTTAWSLAFPLFGGPNVLNIQGLNRKGAAIPGVLDTIIITNNASGSPLPVVINEWMADNAGPGGYQDPLDGLYQDWFELFNPNTNAVNLTGFTLTDSLNEPGKWTIPSGTIIPAGGFLLVWADNEPFQNATNVPGHLHAGFQLNNGGEEIGLFTPAGIAQHTIIFGRQTENVSEGLFPDGDVNQAYSMTNWTPRAPNTLLSPLRITEVTLNAGVVTITWAAVPGRNYEVLYKDHLSDPGWLPLPGQIQAVAETASKIDSVESLPHRFYRVVRIEE